MPARYSGGQAQRVVPDQEGEVVGDTHPPDSVEVLRIGRSIDRGVICVHAESRADKVLRQLGHRCEAVAAITDYLRRDTLPHGALSCVGLLKKVQSEWPLMSTYPGQAFLPVASM